MRYIRNLAAAAALAFAAQAAQAVVPLYSTVYVFGDSLVDAGNAQKARVDAGKADPASSKAGYVDGRFSNGANFADYISIAVTPGKAPTVAALKQGNNYAVGGATTATPATPFDPADPRPLSFLEQIGRFGTQTIASDALVLVTFGGNDVRNSFGVAGDQTFDTARSDLRSGLNLLVGAGARNIIVTGLPDIGKIPETRLKDPSGVQGTLLTQRSQYLNNQFAFITSDVRGQTGADLDFFDLLTFQGNVLTSPASYGLPSNLNSTSYCQAGGAAAVNAGCTGYLYFDPIHPTTQVHQAIANQIVSLAALGVPEPSTWATMIAGTGAIGAALRRRRQRQTPRPAFA